MLDHLTTIEYSPDFLDDATDDFVPVAKAEAAAILDAQAKTADWMKDLGIEDDEDVFEAAEKAAAQEAFAALTTDAPQAKNALLNLKVPAAVRQTVAMLETKRGVTRHRRNQSTRRARKQINGWPTSSVGGRRTNRKRMSMASIAVSSGLVRIL